MLDFLSIDTGTIVLTLLNTLILFLVVKHFLFGRVNKILEERQADVTKTYEEADKAKEKAKALEADYTELMAKAKDESAEIVKNATKKAQVHSDEIISNAKAEANSIISRANDDIEHERQRTMNEMMNEISGIAAMMAEKIIKKEINQADHEALINDFIENVGDDVWQQK
ncbi:MAG: F0F1 ATP synthase subunit B [Oscillospiraceae bacterium]|nr:F0F1 ATP synthase subunit B [Ruminococcus sp.]MBP1564200.1 F0F1 ATP synthase subunit B [Oscillospiraceae bacterium]MBQ9981227.1 F0F1 ATP synthase subunit B [Oscillospiraceae bacterium]